MDEMGIPSYAEVFVEGPKPVNMDIVNRHMRLIMASFLDHMRQGHTHRTYLFKPIFEPLKLKVKKGTTRTRAFKSKDQLSKMDRLHEGYSSGGNQPEKSTLGTSRLSEAPKFSKIIVDDKLHKKRRTTGSLFGLSAHKSARSSRATQSKLIKMPAQLGTTSHAPRDELQEYLANQTLDVKP